MHACYHKCIVNNAQHKNACAHSFACLRTCVLACTRVRAGVRACMRAFTRVCTASAQGAGVQGEAAAGAGLHHGSDLDTWHYDRGTTPTCSASGPCVCVCVCICMCVCVCERVRGRERHYDPHILRLRPGSH